MRWQTPHQPACPNVPQEDGLVVAAAGEDIAFGREGEAVDVVVVAEKWGGLHRSPRDPVPEANGLVVGAGGDGPGIGRPGHGRNAGHVADEGVHVPARAYLPYLYSGIGRRRRDPPSIGRYADLRYRLLVAGEEQAGDVVRLHGLAYGRRQIVVRLAMAEWRISRRTRDRITVDI